MNARRFMGVAATLIVAVIPVAASARDCNEIKAEMSSKITTKGVTGYILEVVDASNVKEGKKIVGTCTGGGEANCLSQRNPSGTRRTDKIRKARWNLTIGLGSSHLSYCPEKLLAS